MKALSIRQPWAWAILNAGKDVENRGWSTSYRGPLLLHASKTVDHEGVEFLRYHLRGYQVPDRYDTGAVVGTVRVVGCERDAPSLWAASNQWHWHLADPQSFNTPVPWRGQLGLFDVPDEVITG